MKRLFSVLSKKPAKRVYDPFKKALIDFQDVLKYLKKEDNILVTAHVNADPDAVASAVLITELLRSLGFQRVNICFPDQPSRLSRKLLTALVPNIKYHVSRLPHDAVIDASFIVDTSHSNHLGALWELVSHASTIIVVDHHVPPGNIADKATIKLIFKEPATTVITYYIIRKLATKLHSDTATLALAGILSDTRRFIHSSPLTFRAVGELLNEGADYDKALALLEEPVDFSERIARLKGVQRSEVVKINNYLVTITSIGSYEASVARALISLGADIAIVVRHEKEGFRISMRSSKTFYRDTGISISGHIIPSLKEAVKGEGGGHDTAGGFSGEGCSSMAIRRILETIFNLTSRHCYS